MAAWFAIICPIFLPLRRLATKYEKDFAMCGIVGAVRAKRNVVDFLTDGLKRLEYRGYDSSGIAVGTEQGVIERVRRVGRVQLMEDAAKVAGLCGHIGIGHTAA